MQGNHVFYSAQRSRTRYPEYTRKESGKDWESEKWLSQEEKCIIVNKNKIRFKEIRGATGGGTSEGQCMIFSPPRPSLCGNE